MPPQRRKAEPADDQPQAVDTTAQTTLAIPLPEGQEPDQAWLTTVSKNLLVHIPKLRFQTGVDDSGQPFVTVPAADAAAVLAVLGYAEDAPTLPEPDSPKMAAIRAVIEAAEGRMRARIDSIRKDLDAKQTAMTEAFAELSSADGRIASSTADGIEASADRLTKLEEDLHVVATTVSSFAARVNERTAAGDTSDKLIEQAITDLLNRLSGIEARVAEHEGSLEALGAEVEEASAVINDELARNTATDAVPPASGQLYAPSGQAIYPAIWAVMRDVQAIGKNGEMKGKSRDQQYSYRTYDDQAEALGAAFRTHGVMIQSHVTRSEVHHREVPGDREWTGVYLTVSYRFTSLIDGSSVVFEAAGEGRDITDKATRKAMTMALKAALDQAFLLGSGEDPDAERPDADEVSPNVVVPSNETPAAREAREAFEARRRAKADQDKAAEVPQAAPYEGAERVGNAEPAASASDPVAHAQQALADGLGARPVEQPRDEWDIPPGQGSTATTLADQQNEALEQADERDAGQKAAARARQALDATKRPGLTLDKLNGIIAQASSEDLMGVEVDGKPLRSLLIAASRTLAQP